MRLSPSILSRSWLPFVVIAVGVLYFWASAREYPQRILKEPGGYNAVYAQALLSGHLYLKKAPPEMEKLADPYDPAQYLRYYTFDLSYYKGAIYSYFGVAPALLLFAPWTLLTGTYLSEQFGVWIFMVLGFALSVALLAAIRRRYLQNAPSWMLLIAVLVVAIGNNSLILFWPPYYSQVVQSCARFLQISALGAAYLSLQSNRRTKIWLAVSSLSAGLMVVARPSFLPAIFLLVPSWWVATRRASGTNPPAPRHHRRGLFLATLVPISVVGLGLMAFNYARFDSPLEFGTTYQQFGQDLREIVQMSPAYLIKNSLQSLFYVPTFTHYYPFIIYQSEPLGALVLLPFSWLTVLLFTGWRTQTEHRAAFGALALSLVIAPVGNLLMLACYYIAFARHHVDVGFPLCFAAAVGLLAAGHAWQGHPWRRRALAVLAPVLAAVNIGVTICFAATYPRQTELPGLEKIFNTPVYLWEKLSGKKITDTLRLDLTFGSAPADSRETLLQTGDDKIDVVFIHYLDNARATLGFFHADLGAIESEPFLLQPGTPRIVELTLGSLCPPVRHPVFAGWPITTAEHVQRRLLVRIDGHTLLAQDMRFHPANAAKLIVGGAIPALNYLKFSGHIAQVTPGPLKAPPSPVFSWPVGTVTVEALFSNRRPGRSEPLVVSGTRTAGDLLRVTYPDDTHVQLVFEHGMTGETVSSPIPLLPDNRVHRITLRPDPVALRTSVLFDDAVVLTLAAIPFPAAPGSVYFGIQTFPANCEPVFGGRLDRVSE